MVVEADHARDLVAGLDVGQQVGVAVALVHRVPEALALGAVAVLHVDGAGLFEHRLAVVAAGRATLGGADELGLLEVGQVGEGDAGAELDLEGAEGLLVIGDLEVTREHRRGDHQRDHQGCGEGGESACGVHHRLL